MSTPHPSVPPVAPDPLHAWIEAHPDELARYRGKRVAIDPTQGIVAAGATYGEVDDQLTALGIPPESDAVRVVIA